MKIMVCETCGRFIHKDERCYHCGGTGMYPAEYDQSVHPAVEKDFREMSRLLSGGDFEKVTELAARVQEWMSFTSEVYWMRLLAERRCATDLELICRGADLNASGDYSNAVKYAEPEEHQVYLDVREKMETIQSMLREKLQKHFRGKKAALALEPADLETRVKGARNRLMELWNELNDVENDIRILHGACKAAFLPHREALSAARKEAETIRRQLDQTKECDENAFRTFQIRIAAAMQMSEEAAEQMKAMQSGHPWAQKYQELSARRDDCRSRIGKELEALEELQLDAERTLDEMEALDRNEEDELLALELGSFDRARAILGEDTFARVLGAAGLAV